METQYIDKPEKKPFNFDSQWLGFACGVLGPMVTFFFYYLISFRYMTFPRYINYLVTGNIYTPVISLCVITNLLVFFIFLWTNKNFGARGVLFSTFLYAFFIFYLKFFT